MRGTCPFHGAAPTAKVAPTSFWEEPDAPAPQEATRELTTDLEVMPGMKVGEYRIDDPLGSGGQGTVFAATDERGRGWAIKVLTDSDDIDALRAEAKLLTQVKHRNVLRMERLVEDSTQPYLVMELVRGTSLDERLRKQGPMSWPAFRPVLVQALEALEAIHDVGLIHRDVKPGNLLLADDGRLVLIDFGTAREGASKGPVPPTRTSLVRGTLEYMSPEQLSGQPLDPRTDLFSLGCVAYVALSGKLPWPGKGMMSAKSRMLRDAEPLEAKRLPVRAASVLGALVQREVAERPSSAREAREALGAG